MGGECTKEFVSTLRLMKSWNTDGVMSMIGRWMSKFERIDTGEKVIHEVSNKKDR